MADLELEGRSVLFDPNWEMPPIRKLPLPCTRDDQWSSLTLDYPQVTPGTVLEDEVTGPLSVIPLSAQIHLHAAHHQATYLIWVPSFDGVQFETPTNTRFNGSFPRSIDQLRPSIRNTYDQIAQPAIQVGLRPKIGATYYDHDLEVMYTVEDVETMAHRLQAPSIEASIATVDKYEEGSTVKAGPSLSSFTSYHAEFNQLTTAKKELVGQYHQLSQTLGVHQTIDDVDIDQAGFDDKLKALVISYRRNRRSLNGNTQMVEKVTAGISASDLTPEIWQSVENAYAKAKAISWSKGLLRDITPLLVKKTETALLSPVEIAISKATQAIFAQNPTISTAELFTLAKNVLIEHYKPKPETAIETQSFYTKVVSHLEEICESLPLGNEPIVAKE